MLLLDNFQILRRPRYNGRQIFREPVVCDQYAQLISKIEPIH